MNTSPVLIVGAGPVGLAAALSLAQQGVAVRIVDRLAAPTNQSRAAIVHARTLEMFERMGIVEDFLAIGVKVHGVALYGPGGKLLTRPNMDSLPTHYPYMLGIDQCSTERLLTARLGGLGVAIEREVELVAFAPSSAGVSATLKSADGRESSAEYSYLLGADGARSSVRHGLGLELEGETMDATWITADVKIRWDRDPDEAVAYLSGEGIAFIAPMNGGRWRVIVNSAKMTPEQAGAITLEGVQEIVAQRFGLEAPLYDPVWISPFSINTRMAPTMRAGRVFLAGDASHVHSPLGGQGMNTGIQDALNLTWKIALVRDGRASASLLDSYDPERHENAKQLLARVGPATRMMNLRQPVAVEIRNRVIHTLGQLGLTSVVARSFSMLEIAYPRSPIIEDHRAGWLDHGSRAGERAPDASGLLLDGTTPRRLHELWQGDPRHQLLLFSGREPTADRLSGLIDFGASFESRGKFLRVLVITASEQAPGAAVDADGAAHDAYGVAGPAIVLVRPDGYIGFRSPASGREALRAYLAEWYPAADS